MAASSPSPPTANRPRRGWRYSLRALLIVVTLACVAVWYWYRVPYATLLLHPKGKVLWQEKTHLVMLAKEVQHFRRVMRGEPIREGLTELFDDKGHRVGQQHWREGILHGPWILWYSTGVVRERGEHDHGRKQGLWEQFDEEGQLAGRMPFEKGDPHGEWEWFDNGISVRTIQFDHLEVTQIDKRHVDDPLGRAYRLGQIDDQPIRDALCKPAQVDFRKTPLKDVADFIADNYMVNMSFDMSALVQAGCDEATPITLQVDEVTCGSLLVLICEPRNLAATYRWGMIRITSPENANDCVDRTGVSTLLDASPRGVSPADRGQVRAALESLVQFDFLDTPTADVAQFLSATGRVAFVADESAKDRPVTSSLRGLSLKNSLGAMCENSGLRLRWKEGKTLVFEPQEGNE